MLNNLANKILRKLCRLSLNQGSISLLPRDTKKSSKKKIKTSRIYNIKHWPKSKMICSGVFKTRSDHKVSILAMLNWRRIFKAWTNEIFY